MLYPTTHANMTKIRLMDRERPDFAPKWDLNLYPKKIDGILKMKDIYINSGLMNPKTGYAAFPKSAIKSSPIEK